MFKKGDKVRCIDASFRNLTEGDVYEVEVSEYKGANNDSFIKVKNDDGSLKEFWASRFELVEEEKKMFKAGNKVRCIDAGDYKNLTEGATYEITSVDDEGYVSLIGDCGDYGEYLPMRFELIEEEKTMTKQNKDFTGLKVGDMLTRRGAQMDWWTEGAKYEVFGDNTYFWITDDAGDKRWFTVEKDGTVSNYDVQRGFCWDKPENKMYKEEDIYADMKLECVSNGGYTHWTEGKVYVVNEYFQIYSDASSSREIPTILQYLNEVDQFSVKFKVVEKVEEPEEVEPAEGITLAITGSNYQELLDQACELKRLLTVHVVNSELADSALVTIKEVFGGTK